MLLKPDQEKVKTLLKDTITLLCKNGLEFKDEFSIDAVIGVTIDRQSLFYVSMTDTIRSCEYLEDEEEEEEEESSSDVSEQGEGSLSPDVTNASGDRKNRKKKKRRRKMKAVSGEEGNLAMEDFPDGQTHTPVKRYKHESGDLTTEQDEHSKAEDINVKNETKDVLVGLMTQNHLLPERTGLGSLTEGTVPVPPAGAESDQGLKALTETSIHLESRLWPGTSGLQVFRQRQAGPEIPVITTEGSVAQQRQLEQVMKIRTSVTTNSSDTHCAVCGKSFNNKCNLKRHQNAHFGIHPYMCYVCQKGFTSKENLKGHIASIHTGYREFRCETCGKEFTRKVHLKSHRKAVHRL